MVRGVCLGISVFLTNTLTVKHERLLPSLIDMLCQFKKKVRRVYQVGILWRRDRSLTVLAIARDDIRSLFIFFLRTNWMSETIDEDFASCNTVGMVGRYDVRSIGVGCLHRGENDFF